MEGGLDVLEFLLEDVKVAAVLGGSLTHREEYTGCVKSYPVLDVPGKVP